MEYGRSYLRPAREEDDGISILSAHAQPSYHAYHPGHSRTSSEDSQSSRTSVALASLPPPLESPGGVEASLFESRAVLSRPYQAPVAYESVTPFRPAEQHGPKPDYEALAGSTQDREPPCYGSNELFEPPRRTKHPWQPGLWARFPWWGMGSLLCVISLTGASVAVLLASNGSAVNRWQVGNYKVQPQVYVSVLTLLMDALLAFGLADGLTIRFWRQAMHGTTLRALHDTYESGFFYGALSRMLQLRLNVVAIACLLVALSAARGPLFQRSSTVDDHGLYNNTGSVNISIASYPLVGYFEKFPSNPQTGGSFTPEISSVIKNFSADLPFTYTSMGCGDYCMASVKGFGFKTNCSTSEQSFDLLSLPEDCSSCPDKACRTHCVYLAQSQYNANFFSVGYNTNVAYTSSPQNQALTLTSVFKADSNCKGNVQIHSCSLYQGVVEYPVILTNGTIQRQDKGQNTSQYWNNSIPIDEAFMARYWPTIFSVLFPPISINVSANEDMLTLGYTKCITPSIGNWATAQNSNASSCSTNSTANQQLAFNDLSTIYATPLVDENGFEIGTMCNLTWKDPMQDMIDTMQSLAFHISVAMATANDSAFLPTLNSSAVEVYRQSWTQTVPFQGYNLLILYKTNSVYVGIAVLVSMVGVFAVLPLYDGWWELGRTASLSPLELARAFSAPLLEGMDGNAGAEYVVVERGALGVRYGAVERYAEEKRLRIEEAGRVRAPWQGELFG
ncbi:hypothetical protein AOQ84DRAFT_391062 [Glonium stellatum]|uniref:Uncharacterized protein n=1 Tax=Glonium stellatum TaxID=574774 RepID=A0A8E2EV06_9PEZI|nr:hypothetical protein AOQ84DRAFT_391062 [Glonium stellatum]